VAEILMLSYCIRIYLAAAVIYEEDWGQQLLEQATAAAAIFGNERAHNHRWIRAKDATEE